MSSNAVGTLPKGATSETVSLSRSSLTWQRAVGAVGVALLIIGSIMGLTWAPPEQHMGDVSRILYVHVPSAWNGLLVYTFAFGFAVVSLWSGRRGADSAMTGAIEAGVVFNVLLLLTGMIFARPTWGIWWDWDVRLTTSLVALLLFGGVLALRALIDEPGRRATWSAVATIVAYADVPIIYFCVRWWRSLHQIQSSPETMSSGIVWPMRINAFAMLFLLVWFIAERAALETERRSADEVPEPLRRFEGLPP